MKIKQNEKDDDEREKKMKNYIVYIQQQTGSF